MQFGIFSGITQRKAVRRIYSNTNNDKIRKCPPLGLPTSVSICRMTWSDPFPFLAPTSLLQHTLFSAYDRSDLAACCLLMPKLPYALFTFAELSKTFTQRVQSATHASHRHQLCQFRHYINYSQTLEPHCDGMKGSDCQKINHYMCRRLSSSRPKNNQMLEYRSLSIGQSLKFCVLSVLHFSKR